MSSEFGYIPESPEQSFGNNKGIFTPTDIYDLTRADKYTNYGQLELIETVNITSSTASVEFTTLGSYNVHFLTINDCKLDVDARYLVAQLSNDGGSSYISSGYQYAYQLGYPSSFSELNSTSIGNIPHLTSNGNNTNEVGNGYVYFYNLLDSTKYSFTTSHSIGTDNATNARFYFGSAVKPTAETHNAIKLQMSSGTGITKANFSLYGIKEYS